MVGDINTNAQLLANETIDAILARFPDEIACACECVRRILGKIARDVDRSAGPITTSREQVTTHYRDLLRDLQAQLGTSSITPWAGGLSIAEADTLAEDEDYPQPAFKVGMDDKP